jgi:hypothetical protein
MVMCFGTRLQSHRPPTYNVERTFGRSRQCVSVADQSEVLVGAVPNEFTLNIRRPNLRTSTFRSWPQTMLSVMESNWSEAVERKIFRSATEYNTSSDVGRIRLSTVSQTDEAPTALFAYVTEMSIAINNNVTPNKAVGVLGAFDVTAGTFQVSGSITAYFANVAATQAVRTTLMSLSTSVS